MIPKEFELNRKAVMELPDIAYDVNDDYRRVTILDIDRLKDSCGCVLPEHSCWACNVLAEYNRSGEIPFGGE